jgi:hypothetical protein
MVFTQRVSRDQWVYRIATKGGASAVPKEHRLGAPIFESLVGNKFLEHNRERGYPNNAMCFTQEAMDWYRRQKEPTDREIQQRLAQALKKHRIKERRQGVRESVDVDAMAAAIGVSVERLVDNVHDMIESGRAEGPDNLENTVDEGWFSLTDDGVAWVDSGFATQGAQTFNFTFEFDFHVIVQATINNVQQAALPDDFKDELIEALKDLEDEPTTEKIQRVMSFGADTAQFGAAATIALPYILAVLQQSGDIFNQLFPFHRLIPS